MPVINIEYDDKECNSDDILKLSNAVQKIVSKATKIEDVSVYANSAKIKVKIAPIEIFVQMSENKISNEDKLLGKIKTELLKWKKQNSFLHPINLTLIPMKWKIEIRI